MKTSYSVSEFFKNCYSLLLTKLFYRPARLIRRPIYIRGRKGMTFKEGFTTGYRCRFEIFNPDNDTKLHIGKNCKIGDNVHIAASNSVVIGDDCLFASNIYISDTNHGDGSESPLLPPDERKLSSSFVEIGNNVWLGEGVAILPGSKIGDGVTVGAHSVVKGQIPPYTIIAGTPAKVIKIYDFEDEEWKRV